MQDNKPFLKVLAGEAQARPPFWFMRQAGRYLPEYRKLRAEKGGFLAMAFDPDAACEITMQPLRRFGMDAAILFSDILTVPMALGQELWFEAGEGPKLGALDLAGLKYNSAVVQPVFDAVNKIAAQMQVEGFADTALIGFAGAPWTVATYMIEGGSSRDFSKSKMMMYQDPQGFAALMDVLVDATSEYLIAQVDAGAEALQIFDSWAGALNAEEFERWCLAPIARIVGYVKAKHPSVPIIGFPRGAGVKYLDFVERSGCDAVGLDQFTPTRWAAENLQIQLPVQGNLDPNLLLAGGAVMEDAVRRILDDLSGAPFVFNLGHGINKETPIAHVERVVEMIKNG